MECKVCYRYMTYTSGWLAISTLLLWLLFMEKKREDVNKNMLHLYSICFKASAHPDQDIRKLGGGAHTTSVHIGHQNQQTLMSTLPL